MGDIGESLEDDYDIARNSSDPLELAELVRSKEYLIRSQVAQNAATSTETLSLLAKDDSPDVREGVASNPNTSSETFALLSSDKANGVRMNLAWNVNVPTQILDSLSNDKDFSVRWNVTENSSTSLETLIKLAMDKHDDVAERARDKIRHKDVLGDLLGESKQAGSLHGLTDEEIIDVIRRETDSDKLMEYDLLITTLDQEMEIARNPNLSESDQHKFVKRDIHTCEALAENQNLAESTALKIIHRTHGVMFHRKIAKKAASKISTAHLIAMLKMEEKYAKVAKEELKLRDVLGDLLGESRCFESFEEWRNS